MRKNFFLISFLFLIASCGKEIKSQKEANRRINDSEIYIFPEYKLNSLYIGDKLTLSISAESIEKHKAFFDSKYSIQVEPISGLDPISDCSKFLKKCYKITDNIELNYQFYGMFYKTKRYGIIAPVPGYAYSEKKNLKIEVKSRD